MSRFKTGCAAGFVAIFLAVVRAGAASGQQGAAPAAENLNVYYAGSGITPAQLLPLQISGLKKIDKCERRGGSAVVAAKITADLRSRPMQ